MTSSFKDQTENIPPLSSDGSTEAKARPSKQSASEGSTQPNTTTTKVLSKATLPAAKPDEQAYRAADTLKIALAMLEKRGLIRRFRVLSKDRTTVKAVVVSFDNTFWTTDLDLKSDNTVVEE